MQVIGKDNLLGSHLDTNHNSKQRASNAFHIPFGSSLQQPWETHHSPHDRASDSPGDTTAQTHESAEMVAARASEKLAIHRRSSSRKQDCPRCYGRGFVHSTGLPHFCKPPNFLGAACVRCVSCPLCDGKGTLSASVKHKACDKCDGDGKVHESNAPHYAAKLQTTKSGARLVYCAKCSLCLDCGGKGYFV